MKENLETLVNEMVNNLPNFKDPTFQKNVINTVLDICCYNHYANVTNFDWLTCTILFSLSKHLTRL